MTIRQATAADISALMPLFDEARATIARLGIDQWQDGYPQRHLVEDGIERGETYCVEIDGSLAATFVLVDSEPLYDAIENGQWTSGDESRDYVAIHRVAVSVAKRGSGISTAILDFAAAEARARGRTSLRIDTHEGNIVMRRMLEKHGFAPCGVIRLENGAPRVAYEKILK